MARPADVEIRFVIVNDRAIRALLVVEEYLEEAAEEREWDKELTRALRAVRFAKKNLTVRGKGE